MINKFDYIFGVVLFILVWDLRAYYKNFLIFYMFFNFGYAYFYPLGAVLVIHFFKDFIRNIQKKESSTYKDGRNENYIYIVGIMFILWIIFH